MARILRCPACGALWRLGTDEAAAEQLVCGECGSLFDVAKAETLEVADDALEAKLNLRSEADEAAEASKADEPEPASDEMPDDAEEAASTNRSSSRTFLWSLLGTCSAAAAIAAGLLCMHEAVLDRAPTLRPVYQSLCGKLPCPGFAWADAASWRLTGELLSEAALSETTPTDQQADGSASKEASHVRVRVRLENPTDRTLLLPLVEMKLLDAAGTPIAERLLEPEQLGLSSTDGRALRLKAGDAVVVDAEIKTQLPIPPASVTLKAWDPQLR